MIERQTLDVLRRELQHPDVLTEYVRSYHAARQRLAAGQDRERRNAERRLGEIARELERVVTGIAKGVGDAEILGARTKALAAERRELAGRLEDLGRPQQVIALHPAALARYEQQLATLQASIGAASDARRTTIGDSLRELVDHISVHRSGRIEIVGRLDALLGAPRVWTTLVAGDRYRRNQHATSLLFRLTG